jgi:hypothetical protein
VRYELTRIALLLVILLTGCIQESEPPSDEVEKEIAAGHTAEHLTSAAEATSPTDAVPLAGPLDPAEEAESAPMAIAAAYAGPLPEGAIARASRFAR